jgi:hypothetical protein
MSINREKVIEPSIANNEKNIGCPPLVFGPVTQSLQFEIFFGLEKKIFSSQLGAKIVELLHQEVPKDFFFKK